MVISISQVKKLEFVGLEYSIDLPLFIVLCSIYGVGKGRAFFVMSKLGFNSFVYLRDLCMYDLLILHTFIRTSYRIETSLLREVQHNVKSLISLLSYKGLRHLQSLPLRGQRTCSNAKTRKKYKIF